MSKPSALVLAEEIQRQFPEEWARLKKRARQVKRDLLPGAERKKLVALWRKAGATRRFKFGPTKDIPFVAKGLLGWEGPSPADISLLEVNSVTPGPRATLREKELLKRFVCCNTALDMLLDDFHKMPEFKAFCQDLKAADKETTRLERRYNFNPDEIIDEAHS